MKKSFSEFRHELMELMKTAPEWNPNQPIESPGDVIARFLTFCTERRPDEMRVEAIEHDADGEPKSHELITNIDPGLTVYMIANTHPDDFLQAMTTLIKNADESTTTQLLLIKELLNAKFN